MAVQQLGPEASRAGARRARALAARAGGPTVALVALSTVTVTSVVAIAFAPLPHSVTPGLGLGGGVAAPANVRPLATPARRAATRINAPTGKKTGTSVGAVLHRHGPGGRCRHRLRRTAVAAAPLTTAPAAARRPRHRHRLQGRRHRHRPDGAAAAAVAARGLRGGDGRRGRRDAPRPATRTRRPRRRRAGAESSSGGRPTDRPGRSVTTPCSWHAGGGTHIILPPVITGPDGSSKPGSATGPAAAHRAGRPSARRPRHPSGQPRHGTDRRPDARPVTTGGHGNAPSRRQRRPPRPCRGSARQTAAVATPAAPTPRSRARPADSYRQRGRTTQVLTRTAAKNLSKVHGQHTAKSSSQLGRQAPRPRGRRPPGRRQAPRLACRSAPASPRSPPAQVRARSRLCSAIGATRRYREP